MKISTSFKYFFRISILSFLIYHCMNAQVTDTLRVEAGWNFLSLPVKVADGGKSVLFPSAVSDAFVFNGSYVSKNNLEIGEGFWLKFDAADTFFITGETIVIETINVHKGWNMIGSLTKPILETKTWCEPYGIRSSGFYHYGNGGYAVLDTIKPGWGYWVQVIQDGKIFISSIGCPCQGTPTIDYAGKTYNTVQIGNKCWLRENLDIGMIIQGSDTAKDNGIIEKYCYDNDTVNCNIYGGLYSWNEAMKYTTIQKANGICPAGWHIPTMTEYQTLRAAVGSDGNTLKAIGQGDSTEWSGDGRGTNTSGFSALLVGFRYSEGYFGNWAAYAYFWSSTQNNSSMAYYAGLFYDSKYFDLNSFNSKDFGFSIRCIKD